MKQHNSPFFTAISGLEGVTLVHHAGGSLSTARHMHESLCIGAVLRGERALTVNGLTTCAVAGDVLLILPGQPHACPESGESEYVMLCITTGRLERLGFDITRLTATSPRLDAPALFGHITRLADRTNTQTSHLEREGTLLTILDVLWQMHGDETIHETQVSAPVETVRRYIETHATEEIPLETLARLANLSPGRLNRLFSAQAGMPPHEYQTQIRIRAVKRLLAEGVGLADAAAMGGFFDQSHMTRCFRKIMGMTPGRYVMGLSDNLP